MEYCGSKDKAEAVAEEIHALGTQQSISGRCIDFDAAKDDHFYKERSIKYSVNNAGITKDNLTMKMSEEALVEVIEVNLKVH